MPFEIFIVEDHPVMREAYASVLEVEPALRLCGTAASAEEAIEVLAWLECDLVVTDLVLPGQSGIDLVRHLRSARPDLPTVVITGHEEEAFAREARKAGAKAYLRKRDLIQTLVPTIYEVLGEQSARSVSAAA
ncbi:MAG TPA: response regulator transcription factor [Rubricoccaceae bacterium]